MTIIEAKMRQIGRKPNEQIAFIKLFAFEEFGSNYNLYIFQLN